MLNTKSNSQYVNTQTDSQAMSELIQGLRNQYKYYIDQLPSDDKQAFIIAKNGMFLRKVNSIGKFTVKLYDYVFPGINIELYESFELNVPKLPEEVLFNVIEFFREVYKHYSSEVCVYLFFNDNDYNKPYYYVMPQRVSSASVNINDETMQEIFRLKEKYKYAIEIHSHHNMTGSFSGIDDRDHNVENIIYMVIGTIMNKEPSISARTYVGGKFVNLPVSAIFDTKERKADLSVFGDWKKALNNGYSFTDEFGVSKYGSHYYEGNYYWDLDDNDSLFGSKRLNGKDVSNTIESNKYIGEKKETKQPGVDKTIESILDSYKRIYGASKP